MDSLELLVHCLILSGEGMKAMHLYNSYVESLSLIVC